MKLMKTRPNRLQVASLLTRFLSLTLCFGKLRDKRLHFINTLRRWGTDAGEMKIRK